MRELRDRVAVVTGAGSGIGRATALALARKGCDLAVVDVAAEGLAETARQVIALGRKASTHVTDVSDRRAMERLPDHVLAEHGRVHILVNNAGVSVTDWLAQHSLEDFDWLLGVNFWGVVHGCKFFLPHLERTDEAHIVNLSSIFGVVGVPTQISYCSAKFAVRGFTETLAGELYGTHIGVTVVHPGMIATNIVRNARMRDHELQGKLVRAFARGLPPEAVAARIVRAIERRQLRVVVGRDAAFLDLVERLSPSLAGYLIARMRRRLGVSGTLGTMPWHAAPDLGRAAGPGRS